jgi:hypothetical protein
LSNHERCVPPAGALRADARRRDGSVREELAREYQHLAYSGSDQSAGLTRSIAKTDRSMEAWYHPFIALDDHSFGPEDIASMSAAFEAALGQLGLKAAAPR